jgi:hypothetical protein
LHRRLDLQVRYIEALALRLLAAEEMLFRCVPHTPCLRVGIGFSLSDKFVIPNSLAAATPNSVSDPCHPASGLFVGQDSQQASGYLEAQPFHSH